MIGQRHSRKWRTYLATIYIDLDDTVADFRLSAESILKRKLGKNCRNITDTEWKRLGEDDFFYFNLELCEGAREFVNNTLLIEGYDIQFLSALPRRAGIRWTKKCKKWWVEKHFNGIPLILTDSTSVKYLYCKPGDILIDDKKDVIIKWSETGGYGIHHESFKETTFMLDTIVEWENSKRF